jgi:predicted dehydrogenase
MRSKVGIIGCGRQAPKHICGLRAWGDVDIVVTDQALERAEALSHSAHVQIAKNPQELFADSEITAISICTPPASHVELINAAISAGKHFLCEKPLSTDLQESRDLVARLSTSGLVGMVGYIYRFSPAFTLAASILDGVRESGRSRVLGKISNALFRLGGPGSHDVWQHRRESQGGAINEMLVHMLDLALWYFGSVQSAELLCSDIIQPDRLIDGVTVEADAEDFVMARFVSQSGVNFVIEADLTTPIFVQYAEIHGKNGSFMGSIQSEMPTFINCLSASSDFNVGRTDFQFEPQNLFAGQMGLFMDCVVNNKPLPYCSLRESIELLETIQRLRK